MNRKLATSRFPLLSLLWRFERQHRILFTTLAFLLVLAGSLSVDALA